MFNIYIGTINRIGTIKKWHQAKLDLILYSMDKQKNSILQHSLPHPLPLPSSLLPRKLWRACIVALTQHLLHLLLDLLHPLGPLLGHHFLIILRDLGVGHKRNEAHVEEEAQVRAAVLHDVAVTVTVVQVHQQEGSTEQRAGIHHATVVDVEAHFRLIPLVDLLKFFHVLGGGVWVLLHSGHHVTEGSVLVLDELLILAECLVDLVDLDLQQTLAVLLRDGLHLVVQVLEVLVHGVGLVVQALAQYAHQGGDDTEDGDEGGGEGRDLLHAAQHRDHMLLHLTAIRHG